MKRILIITIALLAGLSAGAQTMAYDAKTWAGGWMYAFSHEGRQNWKPEFTARYYAGFVTDGTTITGGERIRIEGIICSRNPCFNGLYCVFLQAEFFDSYCFWDIFGIRF